MNENDELEEQMEEPEIATQTEERGQEESLEWQKPAAAQKAVENGSLPWLKAEDINDLQSRWNSIQIGFVDDPHGSVKQADELMAEAIECIEQAFSTQRTTLDEKWVNKQDVSTEDLRIALQGYRSFINRLLAI